VCAVNRPFGQRCSIARTLDVVGDRWTLLILRDAFGGLRHFGEFRASLGIATNILTDRLERLVDSGILRHDLADERPQYRLTDKGRDLYPVIAAMLAWGDRYTDDGDGPPHIVTHRSCDHRTTPTVVCSHCSEPLTARNVDMTPSPKP
jgi:DNA-binding HxlR family transcriptional regulator